MDNKDYQEALQGIEQVKKDFYEVFEKTEAGGRVLSHLKEVFKYHIPSQQTELHLYLQDMVTWQVIDHIQTILEQPKETIYKLQMGEN